jgi:O-antigen ligase
MASTSPFHPADDSVSRDTNAELAGSSRRLRKHGKRASRRGSRARARKQAMLESMVHGLPDWDSLKPVLIFLTIPAFMAFGITISGGHWPMPLLYGAAILMGLYVAASAFHGVELVLACTLFYLPFSTTYVIPLAPGVNGTNMLILLGLFASILRAVDRRQGWLAWPPGTSLVFFFAVLSTISGFTVTLLPGGYAYLMYSEILNYKAWIDQFLLYFIALSCIRDTATAKRMVVYMAIGTIVLVLYSVPEMLEKMGRSTIEKSRIEGPHRQSNNFGGFVAYTLLPLVAIFMAYIKDIRAWLITPYFLVAAKVLISTFSRGAYLAMALGGFLAAYYKGRGFLIFWATLVICFLLVFPSVIPQAVIVRLQSITENTASTASPEKLDKSSENRLILWRAAGKMILEDPVFGKGFKAFPRLKAEYTEQDVLESDPHNMYLYIGSQMGLPALSLFLLILAYSFHLGRVLSRNREDRFIRAIGIGGAASSACYAVICVFGSRAVNLEFSAYFWTYLVAMQVIRQQLLQAEKGMKSKKQRTNAFEVRGNEMARQHIEGSPVADESVTDESDPLLPADRLRGRRRARSLLSMASARTRRRRLK